ncbi:GNAT family N-acetyltransferase [Candidatus Soleaferrea massiliensis]|uniref:GNAT family N-acetyltransferase n=1 Tax=Candidatus Soleaferrea massiliensis TaxID=1470354 RepID=UPI0005906221|nr:GNAT family N-acetyltransferase [Candidatus Soleaferrea massiliensis]
MHIVKPEDMHRIAPLFEGWKETMIDSCLQGLMGSAWTDDLEAPQSAQIVVGDFCFFAGRPDTTFIRHIPEGFSSPCILMIPGHDGWNRPIEHIYPDCEAFTRYAFQKDGCCFNCARLEQYAAALPTGYRIQQIDRLLYDQIRRQDWAKDLCAQFPDYDHYRRNGLGFAVLHENQVVSGASSYTYYNGGIEIEIDTHEAHRRKGLALACASRLILTCLSRGIYPSWDAANMDSVALAQKLGYVLDKPYRAYAVSNPNRE